MKKPWDGGPAFADDPLTIMSHLRYYWHLFRMRTSRNYRDKYERLENLIKRVYLFNDTRGTKGGEIS